MCEIALEYAYWPIHQSDCDENSEYKVSLRPNRQLRSGPKGPPLPASISFGSVHREREKFVAKNRYPSLISVIFPRIALFLFLSLSLSLSLSFSGFHAMICLVLRRLLWQSVDKED